MGMSAGGSSGLNSEINVTPMVDIMLVLLIIFILVTPTLQQGVSVNIPLETAYAKEDPLISSKDSLVVSVKKGGRYFLGDKEYQIDDPTNPNDEGRKAISQILKNELEKKKTDAEKVVYIKADVDADYGQVVGIIDVIRSEEAGGTKEIGLVADRKRGIDDKKIPD
jgi:biopolymer transport protein ExbD/biopolymer transport protein TolR